MAARAARRPRLAARAGAAGRRGDGRRGGARCGQRSGDGVMSRREIEALVGKPAAAGVGLWTRPGPRAAVGHVGAPARGPVRGGRRLARPAAAGAATRSLALVRRYLGGFGPASRADIASFTGLGAGCAGAGAGAPAAAALPLRGRRGAPRPAARAAARRRTPRRRRASCRPGTRRCSSTRAGRESCPRSTGRGSSTPRTRTRSPTFLVDGCVAGTWRYADGAVRLEPFAALAPGTGRRSRRRPRRSAAFHA